MDKEARQAERTREDVYQPDMLPDSVAERERRKQEQIELKKRKAQGRGGGCSLFPHTKNERGRSRLMVEALSGVPQLRSRTGITPPNLVIRFISSNFHHNEAWLACLW